MKIGALRQFTMADYPGKLACTVFLVNCNYQCPFCYNPKFVLPQEISALPAISKKDFFSFLKREKGVIEGVCVSGGEPTLSADLPKFLKQIKKLGYKIKIDTNGSNPDMLRKLIVEKLVDYITMDIKGPKQKYAEAIGFETCSTYYLLEKIEKSIKILKKALIDYEFRTTVVPGLLDKKDILKIAHWIAPAKKYYLQSFKAGNTLNADFSKISPYPKKYLFQIQQAIAPFFEICKVR